MAVSIGANVEDTDYNDLAERVRMVLGNSGYGQEINKVDLTFGGGGGITWPDIPDVSTTDLVDNDHWNNLRTQINRASIHQQDSNQNIGTIEEGRIIGANTSGTSVTRVDTNGVISWTHQGAVANKGVNSFVQGVVNIENNFKNVHPNHITLTNTRAFANSTRTASWGGAGQISSVDCTFEVQFTGGYTVTNDDGSTTTATGADHRRHFFNAGGQIRISGANVSSDIKGSDWATMLGNMKQVVFDKDATRNDPNSGTGRPANGSTDVNLDGLIEPARGNDSLTTGLQLIYQRNGGDVDSDYAENTISIYAKRNVGGDIITFYIQLEDADAGDQTGIGPPVDEPVTGNLVIGLDLARPSGDYVSVPEPSPAVANELFQN